MGLNTLDNTQLLKGKKLLMDLECGKLKKIRQAMLDNLLMECQMGMANILHRLVIRLKVTSIATSAMLESFKLVFHQEEVPTVE